MHETRKLLNRTPQLHTNYYQVVIETDKGLISLDYSRSDRLNIHYPSKGVTPILDETIKRCLGVEDAKSDQFVAATSIPFLPHPLVPVIINEGTRFRDLTDFIDNSGSPILHAYSRPVERDWGKFCTARENGEEGRVYIIDQTIRQGYGVNTSPIFLDKDENIVKPLHGLPADPDNSHFIGTFLNNMCNRHSLESPTTEPSRIARLSQGFLDLLIECTNHVGGIKSICVSLHNPRILERDFQNGFGARRESKNVYHWGKQDTPSKEDVYRAQSGDLYLYNNCVIKKEVVTGVTLENIRRLLTF